MAYGMGVEQPAFPMAVLFLCLISVNKSHFHWVNPMPCHASPMTERSSGRVQDIRVGRAGRRQCPGCSFCHVPGWAVWAWLGSWAAGACTSCWWLCPGQGSAWRCTVERVPVCRHTEPTVHSWPPRPWWDAADSIIRDIFIFFLKFKMSWQRLCCVPEGTWVKWKLF